MTKLRGVMPRVPKRTLRRLQAIDARTTVLEDVVGQPTSTGKDQFRLPTRRQDECRRGYEFNLRRLLSKLCEQRYLDFRGSTLAWLPTEMVYTYQAGVRFNDGITVEMSRWFRWSPYISAAAESESAQRALDEFAEEVRGMLSKL